MSSIRKKTKDLLKNQFTDKNLIENLEKGIFNFSITKCKDIDEKALYSNEIFIKIYKEKLKLLLYSLLNNNNLKSDIKKTDEPHKFAFMTEFELNQIKFDDEIENDLKELKIATNMFICPSCGKNKCIYVEKQTRSADEGATLFITCLKCNHKWKEN